MNRQFLKNFVRGSDPINSKKRRLPVWETFSQTDRSVYVLITQISAAGLVLTGLGRYDNLITDVDEQRNHDLCTGLKGCRLLSTGCGVALYAWLRVGNLEGDLQRWLNSEYLTLVGVYTNGLVLLYELHLI